MDIPDPGAPDVLEVLVAVEAVGINFPDVLIIADRYQRRPARPFAPGGEFAGTVVAVGAGVQKFKAGDRVFGWCVSGALAERLRLPAAECLHVPPGMPMDEAASLLMTYGTAHYALTRRGQLRRGESVLVLGAAGGLGVASIEIARAHGAGIIGAVSSMPKADFVRDLGVDEVLIYPAGPLDRNAQRELAAQFKLATGGGCDLVADNVGGSYSEPALRCLNWGGRFLVMGFPAGIPAIPLNLPLLKSCQIVGVAFGAWLQRERQAAARLVDELLELYRDGRIRPRIQARFPLARGGDAIAQLSERRAIGKIVVTI
ncbi:MAG: NADPH:quinone oxidoreductase family protein [Steroidobacteraceae bacterium]